MHARRDAATSTTMAELQALFDASKAVGAVARDLDEDEDAVDKNDGGKDEGKGKVKAKALAKKPKKQPKKKKVTRFVVICGNLSV